jgi:hypothetical protein
MATFQIRLSRCSLLSARSPFHEGRVRSALQRASRLFRNFLAPEYEKQERGTARYYYAPKSVPSIINPQSHLAIKFVTL